MSRQPASEAQAIAIVTAILGAKVVKPPPKKRRKGRPTAEEWFWQKVDKNGPIHPRLGTPCWLWMASKVTGGYGQFWPPCRRAVVAHRFAYELLVGPIPEGMELDHRCHIPACVNPEHLRPVTHQQNLENLAGPMSTSTIGIRGVYRDKRSGRLRVEVQHRGRRHRAGSFDRTVLAEQAAIRLRNELFTHNDADRAANTAEAAGAGEV